MQHPGPAEALALLIVLLFLYPRLTAPLYRPSYPKKYPLFLLLWKKKIIFNTAKTYAIFYTESNDTLYAQPLKPHS